MQNYVIITESCCDLPLSMIEEFNVKTIPMSFILDDKEYKQYSDNRELSLADFYTKLRSGLYSKTAAVNLMDTRDVFEEELKNGKDILYIGFSSALSSNFQSVNMVVNELREDYPDRKIEVIDSLSASIGLGLLVYYGGKSLKNGFSLEDTKSYIESLVPSVSHSFMVDDLNFLKYGGRISTTTALAGNLLNVKPILRVSNLGEVELETKVRGRIKGVKHLMTKFSKNCNNTNIIFIVHTDNIEEAEKLKLKLEEDYSNSEIHIVEIGPVIGSHLGPGALGIIFFGDER